MKELLEFTFSGVNIIPTILLLFVVIYWLIVIVGIIDIDSVDFDLDMDADVDVDLDGDISGGGGLSSVLSFFNIGDMPLMIFVTFFALSLWTSTLIANDLLGISSWLIGIGVLLSTMFLSLFVAKFSTTPIAKFYKKVREENEAVKHIVGQVCTAKIPISHDRTSQAEIKVNGTSVLINAKTREEGEAIAKGATALVIDFDEPNNLYYVEPYNI